MFYSEVQGAGRQKNLRKWILLVMLLCIWKIFYFISQYNILYILVYTLVYTFYILVNTKTGMALNCQRYCSCWKLHLFLNGKNYYWRWRSGLCNQCSAFTSVGWCGIYLRKMEVTVYYRHLLALKKSCPRTILLQSWKAILTVMGSVWQEFFQMEAVILIFVSLLVVQFVTT